MKARKVAYIILGCLLILLNIFVDIVNADKFPAGDDGAYNTGYLIGSHIFIIFGVIFLFSAFRLHKKIKARPDNELEKNIGDIGKN